MIKKYTKLVLLYIQKNKLTSMFWIYVFGSILLKVVTDIDVTISCPIKYFLGISCYGCGITSATVLMLKLDFVSAWKANPIAFIVDPLLLFFFVRHWFLFLKEHSIQNT